jgi:hypothetical protein
MVPVEPPPPPPPPQSSLQVDEVMVSVTGTDAPVAPEALSWMEPVYVPADMRLGFTLTMTEPEVVPLPGLTPSHEPPEADAENGTVPLASETMSFCDAGIEPPAYRKDSDVGAAASALEVVELLTVMLTDVEWLKLPEVPVTVTPIVIGAAELVAEIVSLLVPVLLIAPNVADKPVGKPGGEKVTVLALKPPVGVIVSVVEPLDPGATVTLLGEEERPKSGAGAVGVTVTVTLAVAGVPVPETVRV